MRFNGKNLGTLLIGTLLLTTSCGKKKSDDSSGSSSTQAKKQVDAVVANINALAIPPGALASFTGTNLFGEENLAVSAAWDGTVDGMSDPRNSGEANCQYTGSVNPKIRMQIELTQSARRCNTSAVNVFGKIQDRLHITCAISSILSVDSSDQLPSSGSQSIDPTSFLATLESCGLNVAEMSSLSEASISFTTPSDTSTYDRVLTFTGKAGEGTMTSTMVLKFNSTVFNYAEGNCSHNCDRAIISMDQATGITKAEYLSGPASDFTGFYHHRLYYDATNDVGMVFSDIRHMTDSSNSDNAVKYLISAKPKTESQAMALNFDVFPVNIRNGQSYSTEDSMDLRGCVSRADGSLTRSATSGEITCGPLSVESLKDTYTSNKKSATWSKVSTEGWANVSATYLPVNSWDMTNIVTTAAP